MKSHRRGKQDLKQITKGARVPLQGEGKLVSEKARLAWPNTYFSDREGSEGQGDFQGKLNIFTHPNDAGFDLWRIGFGSSPTIDGREIRVRTDVSRTGKTGSET